MYIPDVFKEVRTSEIQRIIFEYPLASMVAHTPHGLIANHIPLLFQSEENTLWGHISIENEMHKLINEDQEILCIFKAEDAYISANDYPSKFIDHKKVPTWNYQVIHIHGTLKFYDDQKSKLKLLGLLTKQEEQKINADQAWKMSDAPKDYLLEMLNEITVFEIKISKVLAKSKLSQNRETADFKNVITRLKDRNQAQLAEQMANLNLNNTK